MNFSVSIFKNPKVITVARYGEAGPGPKGSVMSAAFQLDGQDFVALNGGPQYKFTPAISFVVNCETQQEMDDLWEKLSAGRRKHWCGWLQGNLVFLGKLSHDPKQAVARQRSGRSKRIMQCCKWTSSILIG